MVKIVDEELKMEVSEGIGLLASQLLSPYLG
jgi:hypothetical protein